MDEIIYWLQLRITSSLKPKSEEIKALLSHSEYRTNISEFLKNEDIHSLFVFSTSTKGPLAATPTPPSALQGKCVVFVKSKTATQLTIENIADNVIVLDTSKNPLKHLDLLLHQVYMPLLCRGESSVVRSLNLNAAGLLGVSHRFMGQLEMIRGHIKGSVVLPIPPVKVMTKARVSPVSHAAFIHLLESTVIGWIKQVKEVLKHDPMALLAHQGSEAGVCQEEALWERRIQNLHYLNVQLDSEAAREILTTLEQANSTYVPALKTMCKDIDKALSQAEENMQFLGSLLRWFELLRSADPLPEIIKYIPPLIHTLLLVWTHSRTSVKNHFKALHKVVLMCDVQLVNVSEKYYHQPKVFVSLLNSMATEITNIAVRIIGDDVLKDPSSSFHQLKGALKVCATFRGCYLDVKAKADEINTKKAEETLHKMPRKPSDSLWSAKLYGPLSAKFTTRGWQFPGQEREEGFEEWISSPWPSHGAPCFQSMNLFMERCNDVLELVETIHHFQLLETVAEIGGAGTASLDAVVKDIQETYRRAITSFTSKNMHMLSTSQDQAFEKSFFDFRITIKELEHQIAGVLKVCFQQCPSINSQLRLLEVFQGVISRECVQEQLKDQAEGLLYMLIEEVNHVKTLYQMKDQTPHMSAHTPPIVNRLLWVKGLQSRISEPVMKLKEVFPLALKGDIGWKLRHLYTEVIEKLERCERVAVESWLTTAEANLSNATKMPLLVVSSQHGELEHNLKPMEVNLDPDFICLLSEASLLHKAPFNIKLSEPVRTMLRSVDAHGLRTLATRLEAVVCKYNEILRTINEFERRLLEGSLVAAQELLRSGLSSYTWSTEETADFVELATSLVCSQLYSAFSAVRNNRNEIRRRASAWSRGCLDVFSNREAKRIYSVQELLQQQELLELSLGRQISSDGHRIQSLVQESLIVLGISEASPAWQDYMEYIDVLLLKGLKQVTLSSLASMLNTVLEEKAPVLGISVELVGGEVGFSPPLEESSVERSLLEHARHCIDTFLLRAALLATHCQQAQGSYLDYLAADKEVIELTGLILEKVQEGTAGCQTTLEVLSPYAYLWRKDVNETFQDFLNGVGRVKCDGQGWFDGSGYLMELMDTLSDRSPSRQSTTLRSQSTLLIEAERAFLMPEDVKPNTDVPSLEDFDAEISTYRMDRDDILRLQSSVHVGWIKVDFQPIKQVLAACAFKWMWTFAKYLIDKMTDTLENLDIFLKRTEPQLEGITGEEKDTEFFMKMMRLFNEVSARQTDMEGQFIVMQKAVKVLEKYEFRLPTESEKLLTGIPGRWNNLKTRVSLAKQRLSPKIQQESESITKDLAQFGDRLYQLKESIEESDVYMRDCSVETAYHVIKRLSKEVKTLQTEAKYLKELQGLLEAVVVDFRILNECRRTVRNLTLMWQAVEVIRKQQSEWKTQPWQDIDTVQLVSSTSQQLELIKSLAREVHGWDVYAGTLESVNVIQLTLPLIEDLLNPAMRTRHWKQLVRVTGGQLLISPQSLRGMTLGDLLALGLQKHADNVKAIVERASNDIAIETGLKNCEEVWLSRIFDLQPHNRAMSATRQGEAGVFMLVTNTEAIFEELEHHQMALDTMKDSSEAGTFLDEVTKWQKKLQIIESIVHLMLQVQDKWVNLEEVFTTSSVCGDLSMEAAVFASVQQDLCSLMKAAEENPNILQICTRQGLQGMLCEMKEKLEKCQHSLLDYLESRRHAFPRLFFLPLQDTLKLICCACNPEVQHHYLYKVFEHMESLIFVKNNEIHEAGSQRIVAVKSFAGEQLYLAEPLECGGLAEQGLQLLQGRIGSALRSQLHAALGYGQRPQREIHSAGARRVTVSRPPSQQQQNEYRDSRSSGSQRTATERGRNGSGRGQQSGVSSAERWPLTSILDSFSQVARIATQINFTRSLERALTDLASGQREALQEYHSVLTESVECAARMLKDSQFGLVEDAQHVLNQDVKSPHPNSKDQSENSALRLTPSKKSENSSYVEKLSSHIQLLSYQCDILRRVMDQVKTSASSHELKLLNLPFFYQYDENRRDIIVKTGQHQFTYGYEYQGSVQSSVVTPLSERAMFHMLAALAVRTGGFCTGPERIGKKTTIKELSLVLGRALYFICCSEALDHKTLSDVCKGVASSGCFVCFDSIDRMRPIVLSEAAHLLGQIHEAMKALKGFVRIQFQEIPLNSLGGYFATSLSHPAEQRGEGMLPGCVSPAAAIPQRLLKCFRIVSITKSSTDLIVESLFKAAGFRGARLQRRKLLALFEIFSAVSATAAASSKHCGTAHGFPWTLSSLRHLISKAGVLLCSLQIGEQQESTAGEGIDALEDRALVMALHRSVIPRLTGTGLTLMCSLMRTLWQPGSLPVPCGSPRDDGAVCEASLSLSSSEETSADPELCSVKVAQTTDEKEVIAKAIKLRQLSASEGFTSVVQQLTHLIPSYQTIAIVGQTGCGKSESLQTSLQVFRELGYRVDLRTIFTQALDSRQLLGHVNMETGCMDGLLPELLRLHWCQHWSDLQSHIILKAFHLDGEIDAQQMECMQAILRNNGSFILPHSEQFKLPGSVKLFWELASLENVSPAVICCMGILNIPTDTESWKLCLSKWLLAHPTTHRHLLQQLTEEFLDPVVTWMRANSSADKDLTASICATSVCVENRVQTFCRIFEALGLWSVEIPPEDVKKCFLFSCVWAFGGTLESEHKAAFDLWWREHFRNSCVIPEEHQIWDYYIDTETCQFVRWSDNVPPQSFPCGQGISSQAFVHTIESEQLFYLTNLLSDAGHPVVLAGETGCGKSAVLNEYMQAHFSGDVVEVLKLKIHVNRSTSSRMLWGSLFDKLEWQYGTLYTPFRKKKLMCFVDDLNSAQVDGHGSQPACELMRQLLDCGGGFDPVSFEWRTVKNVAFLATVNTSCPSSPRLLRHFAVFRCSYPSCDDQYRIFSTLLNSYFLQSSPALKKDNFTASADPVHRELLSAVTLVTVETQDRLRTMFLRISQRGHYMFTLRDLAKIFRNLCLSLNMNGSSKALLYLWRHECDWVYGHRLASYVDYARYKQEFNVAVKKVFADNEQVELITSPTQPLFSNVINLEGGLVTASPTQWQLRSGNQMKLSNQDMSGDGYRHNFDEDLVRKLLEESVQEHNKTNPRIAISFYRSTMELVCRLTRNLLSPHEVAHTLLCGEGCPGMAVPVTKLAAHLCGFSLVRIHSFSRDAQSIDSFKSQLVDCCVQAGIQGKKVLCLMNEERLDKATMVYFTHLVVPGSITHLFSSEQLSSIINEVRSEALTENISSTKEAVLEFFVQRVTQNLRCVLICPSTGCSFSQNCQEFPIFTNTVNIYFVPHWSRSRLVEHALYHVGRLKMLTAQERENICHLLASMHLAVGKSDGRGKGMGRFGHLTNSTYESFARTFVRLFDRRHAELVAEHRRIEETLGNIDGVLKASAGLRKASQQAEVILEEHKKGAKQILTQIGQDRAVAEQQVRTVREQMGRIEKLQRLLPEYQLAHARSVYKCTAMASDIKKLVGEIDIEALGELRAMQQPDVVTEDLMASIITILKSPTADLTWSKGAKRQMANLERFLDELSTFDEIQLSETTLGVLEKYLQKPSFTAENMERKTPGNSAASSLLKWLQGAVSYHRVMMSKVRPLQSKVAEMSAALEESVQRLKSQQTRKAALLRRLEELEKGFEEASIDKNEQERKSAEISKKLAYLSTVEQVLQLERRKYSLISCCMAERLQGLPGSTAMAAGLLCYLGPYEHLFCQLLLSLEWPRCLRDRGLSFLIDSFDPVKGRVIDFSVEFFKREGEETEKETNVMADSKQEEQNCQGFAEEGGQDVQTLQEAEGPADAGSFSADLSAPVIASEHYHDFVKALLKIVAGDEKIHHWVLKDWTLQQMQNAVILLCSWQRPPFLMHPSNEAEKWFQELQETSPPMSATSLRLGEGPDGSISLAIEKALHSGHSLFIYNYTQLWASLIRPLIEHCNTVTETEPQSDNCSSIVCLEGRRLLGSDQFKLYLATSQAQRPLPADISSGATLVNCSEDEDTIRDFLLHRLFAGTQQDLHRQLKNASKNVHQVQCLLKKLEQKFQESLNSSPQDIEAVTAIFNNRKQLSEKLERAKSLESRLFELRNKLLPIAQRGAQLFSVLQALRMLAREYKFPLSYFLRLFDKAVGNTFTENKEDEKEEIDIKVEDARKNTFNQANSVTDPEVTEADDSDDRQHGGDIPGREALERNLDEPVMDPHVSEESPSSQLGFPMDTADISRKHKPPSPAADSLSLSTNEIRQLVDQLTETVHQTINQSLYPEHSLVFSCMLSLYIQMESEGALREEEVSFLLKGFQDYDGVPPSLRDLGSEGLPPAWMPAEQWECLLALSLLPGPLEGVCVQIAEHSTEWERWFNLDYPELERLPLEGEPAEMNGAPESPDTRSVSGMHKLLLLRALRPDRLISALPRYLLQHDSVCTWGGSGPQAADVKSLVEDSVGILVLLPAGLSHTNGLSNVCSVMSVQPTTVICSAAKEMGISVSVVSTREDCLSGVEKALGDMMECGGWLVVENVHLASMSLLKKIHHTMNLAAKQSNNQFRLWLTAEPGAPFPEDFLSEIHKVSWHALMTHCLMGSDLFHGLRGELLPMAVVLALEQVHEKVWKRVLDLPAECRGLCFGTGVLHGLIVGSQFIPGSGLSQVYPLNDTQLLQAMDAVISSYGEGGVISNSFIQVLIEKITEIYLNTVTVSEDALYIEALAQEVLLQCPQPHGKIAIGEFVVPIPAANIEPVQYSRWLCRHLSEFDSCPGLALHKSTQKLQNQSRVAGLLHNLSEVYEVLQCGLPSADHEDSIAPLGVSALSLSLDLVLEQLPGLLEVDNGPLPWSLVSSLAKAEDCAVVKTVGYALLEECLWMNCLLCRIRQQVTELSSCTLREGCAFPPHLAEVSQALEKGRAPQPWLPPNCQPSVTSLQTWLEDLKKKHSQLKQWVEESGRTKAQGSVSNEVTSVWLGALVNPAALILALRHEYAIANMCLLDETAVRCHVSRSREPSDQYDIQPHCLTLEGLCLQGASWDFSNNVLVESSEEFVHLPYVTVRPILHKAAVCEGDRADLFECPVYMTPARKSCLLKLPLRSTKPAQYWHLKKAAVILDCKTSPYVSPSARLQWAARRNQKRLSSLSPLPSLRNIPARIYKTSNPSRISSQLAEIGGIHSLSQEEHLETFEEYVSEELASHKPKTSENYTQHSSADPKTFLDGTDNESPDETSRVEAGSLGHRSLCEENGQAPSTPKGVEPVDVKASSRQLPDGNSATDRDSLTAKEPNLHLDSGC